MSVLLAAAMNRPIAALDRYRNSQRHAVAKADWPEVERVWTWLNTSAEEQRVICSQTHQHRGICVARHGHPKP